MATALQLGSLNYPFPGAASTEPRVVRIDQGDAASWALYPRFEERSILFAEKYLNFTATQIRGFQQDLRNRFVTPGGALYIAGLTDDRSMVAHFNGWINMDYGQPYLFIFQTEVDDGYDFSLISHQVFAEMNAYMEWANSMYETANQSTRVNKVVMQTFRHDGAFIRYLKAHGVSAVKERSVLGWYV